MEFQLLAYYCAKRFIRDKSICDVKLIMNTLKHIGDTWIEDGQRIKGLEWNERGQEMVSSLMEEHLSDFENLVPSPVSEKDVRTQRVCDALVKEYVIVNREDSKVSFRELEFVAFYVAEQVLGIKDRKHFDGFMKSLTDVLTTRFPSLYISSDKAYLKNLGWSDKALKIVDFWNDNDPEPAESMSMSEESSLDDDDMKLEDEDEPLEDDDELEDEDEVEEVEPMDLSDEEEEFNETTQRGLFKKIVHLTSVDGLAPLFVLSDFDNEERLYEFYDFSANPEVQRLVDLLLEKKRVARKKKELSVEDQRKKQFFEDFGRSFTNTDRDELLQNLARREKNVVMTCRANMGHGKKEQLLLFDCVLQRSSDFYIVSQKPCKDLCDFCGMRRMVAYQLRDRKSGIVFLLGTLCHDLAKATIDLGLKLPECKLNDSGHQRKLQRLVQKMSDANELKRTGSE